MKKYLIAFAVLAALSVSAYAGSSAPLNAQPEIMHELAESIAASFFIICIYAIYWLKETLPPRDMLNAR